MAFTYTITSATEISLNGLSVISDGTSSSITLALSKAPFNLSFNSTSDFPVTSTLGLIMSFIVAGNSTVFPITTAFDSTLFTLTITFTSTIPPAGSVGQTGNITLMYQG